MGQVTLLHSLAVLSGVLPKFLHSDVPRLAHLQNQIPAPLNWVPEPLNSRVLARMRCVVGHTWNLLGTG